MKDLQEVIKEVRNAGDYISVRTAVKLIREAYKLGIKEGSVQ